MTRAEAIVAALDRMEAGARAATPGPWQVEASRHAGNQWVSAGERGYDDVIAPTAVACGSYCQGGSSQYSLTQADAAHIAALDPAFVLGLVERLRAILDLHGKADSLPRYCQTCDDEWPCRTLVQLGEALGVSGDE